MNFYISGKAYGKINLSLHIVGKRKDGYHFLESVMSFLDLYDNVRIKHNNNFSVKYYGPFSDGITIGEDTVTKAVSLLEDFTGKKFNVFIGIEKNIPWGSGMGGGSSDAAIVLRMLVQTYNISISKIDLYKIGEKVGADVPVCLENRACLVKGIGEDLTPLPYFEPLPVVLVNPKKPLTAKEVYQRYEPNFSQRRNYNKNTIMKSFTGFKNDLYKPASELVPEIKGIVDKIGEQKGCILNAMSGGGSTCFGIFRGTATRDAAYKTLKDLFADYLVIKANVVHKGDTNFSQAEIRGISELCS